MINVRAQPRDNIAEEYLDMSLCTRSKESREDGYTMVENAFVDAFMPQCDPTALKVYLYGLYLCSDPLSQDNTLSHVCDALALSQQEVTQAFGYWADRGLLDIVGYDPLQIRYRSARTATAVRHYKKEKFADFNAQLEALFPSVVFANPNQYLPYYDFIEESKIKPEVMLMIIRYCVNTKGEKIRSNYVLAVARNWVSEGVRTLEDVEARIRQMELASEALRSVAAAVGKKSELTLEDKQYYLKWTDNWGFGLDSVLTAAKQCKNKGGFARLDALLDEYFRNNCLSPVDIERYAQSKRRMRDCAAQIVKRLGLWYDSLDFVVEKYVAPWTSKGFDADALCLIAEYCFTNSIRTLEGMQSAVQKFYKHGCMSVAAIQEHLGDLVRVDRMIRDLLEQSGCARNVTAQDRTLYATWTNDWGFATDALLYAARQEQGKPFAFNRMHRYLGRCHAAGAHTVEQMQRIPQQEATAPKSDFNNHDRKYTKEDLSAFFNDFDSLDKIEV